MSEALNRIKKFRLDVLAELLAQCTPAQQDLFFRMYRIESIEFLGKIPESKLDWAIQQCENTIKKK